MTSAHVIEPGDGDVRATGTDAGPNGQLKPESAETIGDRLRDARTRKGWSLAAASHVSGISAAALGSYERGSRTLTVATLAEVARTYSTNVLEVIDPIAASTETTPQVNCVLLIAPLGRELRWGSLHSFAVRVTTMRGLDGSPSVILRRNELDVIAASYSMTTAVLIEHLIAAGCAERLPADHLQSAT